MKKECLVAAPVVSIQYIVQVLRLRGLKATHPSKHKEINPTDMNNTREILFVVTILY